MLIRLTAALIVATALLASPAAAMPQTVGYLEPTKMMGRWYEIARLPNSIQKGCQAGASDWTRSAEGFSVVQSCHKGAPDGPLSLWRAKARVADPTTNAKFKMSFFGGMVSQEYWVLEHRAQDGWLILGTPGGNYLWLMSTKPLLAPAAKAQALSRIKQMGYDTGRLEFPAPAKN